jgi:hypothetical protein
MLVSQETADKMYNKNGKLYKSFALLFSNSIWNKSVPNGFPICPYFWMSLFSMVLFVPFIEMPVKYVVKPLSRGLWKLFMYCIIAPISAMCTKCNVPLNERGAKLLANSILAIWGLSLYTLLSATVIQTGIAGFITPFYLLHALFIGLFVAEYYNFSDHSNFKQHWIYPALFIVGAIIISTIFTPYAIPALFSGTWLAISSLVGLFITVVAYFAVLAFDVAVIVFSWAGGQLSDLLPVILLGAGGIAILSVLGYIAERYLYNVDAVAAQNQKRDYSHLWTQLFFDITKNEVRIDEVVFQMIKNKVVTHGEPAILTNYKVKIVLHDIVKKYYKHYIKELEHINPARTKLYESRKKSSHFYANSDDEAIIGKEAVEILSKAQNVLDLLYTITWDISDKKDNEIFKKSVKQSCEKLLNTTEYVNEMNSIKKKIESKSERRKMIEEQCESFCNKVVVPIQNKAKFVKSWFALGWSLVKKKKSEACPYFTFKDSE